MITPAEYKTKLKQALAMGNHFQASELLKAEESRLVELLKKATTMDTVRHLQGQLEGISNVQEALS